MTKDVRSYKKNHCGKINFLIQKQKNDKQRFTVQKL